MKISTATGRSETHGQFPSYEGAANAAPPPVVGPGGAGALDTGARPWTGISGGEARVNRAVLFRRAVKLTNGQRGNSVSPGLTIAAENPVYVQGNWNADATGFGDPHVATSVAADAVTMSPRTTGTTRRGSASPHRHGGSSPQW